MASTPPSTKLHKLLLSGKRHSFKSGEVVQSTDSELTLALLHRGYLKRYLIKNDGSLGVQSLYGPGDFFPLTLAYELLFNHSQHLYVGPETFYYASMSPVVIYTLDNNSFLRAVADDPIIYRDLFAEAGKRLYDYIHKLENMTLPNAYKRVAHHLLFCAKEFGDKDSLRSVSIVIPLTHQTIADILSVTRETATQAISELRRRGLVKVNRRTIIVPDLNKLEAEAYS